MVKVSSLVGSGTFTGWKRLSNAWLLKKGSHYLNTLETIWTRRDFWKAHQKVIKTNNKKGNKKKHGHLPCPCLVLLDVLPVLLNGGSSNDLQLAAGQRRLHDVPSVNGTATITCTTRTNDGVDLIDHQNDLFLGVKNLLDNLSSNKQDLAFTCWYSLCLKKPWAPNILQTLLKFATVTGSSQQHGQIQLHNTLAWGQWHHSLGLRKMT